MVLIIKLIIGWMIIHMLLIIELFVVVVHWCVILTPWFIPPCTCSVRRLIAYYLLYLHDNPYSHLMQVWWLSYCPVHTSLKNSRISNNVRQQCIDGSPLHDNNITDISCPCSLKLIVVPRWVSRNGLIIDLIYRKRMEDQRSGFDDRNLFPDRSIIWVATIANGAIQ